jgi:hypothetical protein
VPGKLANFRLFERWEERFEDALCLPLCRIGEVNPDVHPSRPSQSGINALDVIGCGEKKPNYDYD